MQQLTTPEQIAARLQVARWLGGIVPDLADTRELEAARARHELFAPFRRLVERGFFGRTAELAQLQSHLRSDHRRPLVISGVGGVGKSTLIAKFVLDTVNQRPGLRFAYLNFDRGALAANQPAQLLAEICLSVGLQEPAVRQQVQPLVEDLRAQESIEEQASGRSTQTAAPAAEVPRPLLDQAARLLRSACPGGLLLVLDTFEEVQRQRVTNIFVLWRFLADLHSRFPGVRVLVSGRALDTRVDIDPTTDSDFELMELLELDEAAAIEMVQRAPDVQVSEEVARRTVELVSRNPLSLRLAIDILRRSSDDDPFIDLEMQQSQIQGQLYRRILLHIEDPEVRKLAHPGLVVRVVTLGVIQHVLARPCGIEVPNARAARELYDALEREATLVDDEGDSLRHRADVRRLMLPSLLRDQPDRARRIHRAAVRYWSGEAGPDARAEELYHRLMLGQGRATLDQHWDGEALASLVASIDELPPASQGYLWAKSGGAIQVGELVTHTVDNQSWVRATAPLAEEEIRAGRPALALELLQQRRGPRGVAGSQSGGRGARGIGAVRGGARGGVHRPGTRAERGQRRRDHEPDPRRRQDPGAAEALRGCAGRSGRTTGSARAGPWC